MSTTAERELTPQHIPVPGFALADWRRSGFEIKAISDLAPAEMTAFAAALDRAIGSER